MTPEQAEEAAIDATGSDLSLGRELRRAREVRGIPLEQVVALTKISERYLLALENDRLDLLPGRLYARNFVRAYARAIGADEDELLDYFSYQARRQDEGGVPEASATNSGSPRRVVAIAVLAAAALVIAAVLAWSLGRGDDAGDAESAAARAAAGGKSRSRPAAVMPVQEPAPTATPPSGATGVPAGPATTEAVSRPKNSRTAATPPAAPADTTPADTTPAPPAGASATAAPGTGAGATPDPAASPKQVAPPPVATPKPAIPAEAEPPRLLAAAAATPPAAEKPASPPAAAAAHAEVIPTVRLQFNEESWAEVRRGGEMLEVGLKRRGDVLSYRLDEPLSLVIGNAGGVALFIDGQAARPLGGASESRSLVLDRRNYRAFLP